MNPVRSLACQVRLGKSYRGFSGATSYGMNIYLFEKINNLAGQNPWLDGFMVFSAEWLGYFLIVGVVLCFFKNREKYKNMLLVSLGSAIVARFIFVEVIRYFYYNPRPFTVLENINVLLNHEISSSFPSGHATFYFALAAGVCLYNKKAGYAYFALAGLMGFARVFVSVHWPLDIIAGAMLGILVSLLFRGLNQFSKAKSGLSA